MTHRFLMAALCFAISACSTLDNAEFASRSTFVHFYENETGQQGVLAEPLADGFLVLANGGTESNAEGYILKTDERGITQWKVMIPGTFRGLVLDASGYYAFGDSIKVNPNANEVADLIVTSAVLYKINLDGAVAKKITLKADTVKKIDYKANAITFNEQNELVLLGTFKSPASKERPYLVSLTTAFDTVWTNVYDVIDRDYVNAKSIHATGDGHLVWASAILKEQQNFSRSYLSIPYVEERSTFENNDVYGETTDQKITVSDIQPSSSEGFGFGLIGSFANPSGENSNMFFARVSAQGSIIKNSARFFDGAAAAVEVSAEESISDDLGTAICATKDGGFALAGTRQTLPGIGNGGTDVLLIKVDGGGNVLWRKTFGGSNDETVGSIRETPDGSLVICGSVDASGLPAIMLIKTDANGEISN